MPARFGLFCGAEPGSVSEAQGLVFPRVNFKSWKRGSCAHWEVGGLTELLGNFGGFSPISSFVWLLGVNVLQPHRGCQCHGFMPRISLFFYSNNASCWAPWGSFLWIGLLCSSLALKSWTRKYGWISNTPLKTARLEVIGRVLLAKWVG